MADAEGVYRSCRICRELFKKRTILFIAILTIICLILSFYTLFTNYPSFFVPFLLFPIVAVSYLYPKSGVYFTGFLGIIYLLFNSFKTGGPYFIPVTGPVYIAVTIVLSIIISLLSYNIKESEKKNLYLINDQTELISRVLPNGKYTIANDAFCNYYGIKNSEIIGKKFTPNMPPEYNKKLQKAIKNLTIKNPLINLEICIVTNEGETRWQNLNIRAFYDEYGLLTEHQYVASDITEKKLFEKELQDKVNYVSALMDSIPAPVFHRNIDGIYCDCNSAFEKLVGKNKSEIIGKNMYDFFPQTLTDYYLEKDREIIEKPHQQQFEYKITDKEGKYHDVLFSKTLRVDAEGNMTGIVGMALDITARKQAEKELQRSLDEKTTLLQEVHHRVKNNLAVINSMLGMQMNDLDNNYFLEPLKDAKSRIISMALVHEELYKSDSIALINAGHHFEILLKELVANFGRDKNIETLVNAEDCHLSIDTAIPCSLVINELITNSLKYAFNESNSGKISISMDKKEGFHNICVSDNGSGMPKGFDFNNSTTLGMKLVKNIVEYQMEGKIELNSDNGTCWNITIPNAD